jgi:hypothetical protein
MDISKMGTVQTIMFHRNNKSKMHEIVYGKNSAKLERQRYESGRQKAINAKVL